MEVELYDKKEKTQKVPGKVFLQVASSANLEQFQIKHLEQFQIKKKKTQSQRNHRTIIKHFIFLTLKEQQNFPFYREVMFNCDY